MVAPTWNDVDLMTYFSVFQARAIANYSFYEAWGDIFTAATKQLTTAIVF